MKNITSVLTWILLVAVGYLFFAHFSNAASGSKKTTTEVNAKEETPKVVYVNGDSLLNKFTTFQADLKALEARSKTMESTLASRGRSLQQEMISAEQKAQSGQMAPAQIQKEQQRLMQKQQNLVAQQESMSKQLLDERQKLQENLEKRVKDLLTAIRKEKGYDFILNYGPGTGVLMVNDSLNITNEVLEKLNAKQ
ncbi:OmpH family outer membrane protein [Haliscomenobacter sp.]|uniref:OmpH family outer membrane protein n=1 Tax=Haliscomenobacter sp. TaxID=2717303 RepID=UPI0035940B76